MKLRSDLAGPYSAEAAAAVVDDAVGHVRMALDGLKAHCGAAVILQTLPHVGYPLFGSLDRRVTGSPRWLIDEVNRRILALAEESGAYLLDVAALAERVGTDSWFDPVQLCIYKLPFAAECTPTLRTCSAACSGRSAARRANASCSTSTTRSGAA